MLMQKTGMYNGKQIFKPKNLINNYMSSFNYTIAIDAMGGENSPDKVIEGISLFLKEDREVFF